MKNLTLHFLWDPSSIFSELWLKAWNNEKGNTCKTTTNYIVHFLNGKSISLELKWDVLRVYIANLSTLDARNEKNEQIIFF